MVSTTAAAVREKYRGTDKLIFGVVLAVTTFGLFAQTTLNVAPAMVIIAIIAIVVTVPRIDSMEKANV